MNKIHKFIDQTSVKASCHNDSNPGNLINHTDVNKLSDLLGKFCVDGSESSENQSRRPSALSINAIAAFESVALSEENNCNQRGDFAHSSSISTNPSPNENRISKTSPFANDTEPIVSSLDSSDIFLPDDNNCNSQTCLLSPFWEQITTNKTKRAAKETKNRRRDAVAMNVLEERNYVKKVVSKPTFTCDLIFDAIKSNILFGSCSKEELLDLVDAFESAKFSASHNIIEEGGAGNRFYVMEEGSVDAFVGEDRVCTLDESGCLFGELAVLHDMPHAATFRAKTDCQLWSMDRRDFRGITRQYKLNQISFKVEVLKKVKFGRNTLGKVLNSSEIYDVALATEKIAFKEGNDIMNQGDIGDIFYLIEYGDVDVYTKETREDPICTLSSGNYFGEKALQSNSIRNATYVAASDVKCFSLSRASFELILGDLQGLLDRFLNKSTPSEIYHTLDNVEDDIKIQLSDLEVKKNLGTGSFGCVKLVEAKQSNQERNKVGLASGEYVLKCYSKEKLMEYGIINRVKHEINIMRELNNNPFIVRFYCEIKSDAFVYLLFEALSGGRLQKVLKTETCFSEEWSQFYSASVLLAFREIHNNKIAYRNLNPENMVMDSMGYIKIVDFCMAKKIQGGISWTLCGNPDYFSPEVVLSNGHDWAVDYWALGVFILEMLTGSPPFSADNEMKVYKNILSGKVPIRPDFSPRLADLAQRLMTASPLKRLGRMKGGANNVMQHPWYSNFDFVALSRKIYEVPIMPKEVNFDDAFNIDKHSGFDRILDIGDVRLPNASERIPSMQPVRASSASNTENKSFSLGKEQNLCAAKTLPVRRQVLTLNSTIGEEEKQVLSSQTHVNNDCDASDGIPLGGPNQHEAKLSELRRQSFEESKGNKGSARTRANARARSSLYWAMNSAPLIDEHSIDEEEKQVNCSQTHTNDSYVSCDDIFEVCKRRAFRNKARVRGSFWGTGNDSIAQLVRMGFSDFYLLSFMAENLSDDAYVEGILDKGPRYLDPFTLNMADLIDQFPSFASESGINAISPDALSKFCFPGGLKIRIIPRCAMEGAERLGWVGKQADQFRLHGFTNEFGNVIHGIAITIKEELCSNEGTSDLIVKLKVQQRKCKAAHSISRWWHKCSCGHEKRRTRRERNNLFHTSKIFIQRTFNSSDEIYFPENKPGSLSRTFIDEISPHDENRDAKRQAKEAFDTMTKNEDVCIVEKCYVLLGIHPYQYGLLLCVLQQMIRLEREGSNHKPGSNQSNSQGSVDSSAAQMNSVTTNENTIFQNRYTLLQALRLKFCESPEFQQKPFSLTDVESTRQVEFNVVVPLFEKINIPLPLPHMCREWGVALLIHRIKLASMFTILKLLLMERSLLVIGESAAEVTTCVCTLPYLLKPYSWASAFIPSLPLDMIDFVGSPVPFIAGVVVENGKEGLDSIENDSRVIDGMMGGLSVLNLSSGKLNITMEKDIADIFEKKDPIDKSSHDLLNLERRLFHLMKNKCSTLHSFQDFFQYGATIRERSVLYQMGLSIRNNLKSFSGALSKTLYGWKQYGEFDETTNEFNFVPSKFVEPLQAQLKFQEVMARTQLFVSFVEEKKEFATKRKALFEGIDALFIANWVFFRWWRKHQV